jgi:tripartite-type tricarboxylate transporter receptor subunit TctC
MVGLLKAGAILGVTLMAYDIAKQMTEDKLGQKNMVVKAIGGGVGAVAVGAVASGLLR